MKGKKRGLLSVPGGPPKALVIFAIDFKGVASMELCGMVSNPFLSPFLSSSFFLSSFFFFLSFSSPSPSPFLCDRSQPSPAMETTGSSGTASLSLLKIGDFITLYSEEVRFLPENLLTLTGVPTKTKKSPS